MHRLLKELKLATGVTTLHVTHNEEEAEALADLRLSLVGGKIIAKGKSG
jgi:ABC-type sulfate/molybdate transport systems ATPase subunit